MCTPSIEISIFLVPRVALVEESKAKYTKAYLKPAFSGVTQTSTRLKGQGAYAKYTFC